MNKHQTTLQFFKDGITGTITLMLIYLMLFLTLWLTDLFLHNQDMHRPPAYFTLSPLYSMPRLGLLSSPWFDSFSLFSPGIFFLIAIFISTGFNIRFIRQDMPTRKDWGKPILKMLGMAWLVILPTTLLYFFLMTIIESLLKLSENHNFHHSLSRAYLAVYDAVTLCFSPIHNPYVSNLAYHCVLCSIGSIIGFLAGFVITYFVAILFNPQKQSTRMFIPIIANLSIIASIHFFANILIMQAFG